jgi:hypothetical protein
MNEQPINFDLTDHAIVRCDQRGVKHRLIPLVLSFGDIEIPAHRGRVQIQLSRKAVSEMLDAGVSLTEVDAVRDVAVIVEPGGPIVTVVRLGSTDRRIRKKLASGSRRNKRSRS